MIAKLEKAIQLASVANWDGEGGLPVSKEVADNARFLLALVQGEANVEVTCNGTVCIQWDRGAIIIGRTRITAYGKDGSKRFLLDGKFSREE